LWADGRQWRLIDLEARLEFSSLDAVMEIYFKLDHTGLDNKPFRKLILVAGHTKQPEDDSPCHIYGSCHITVTILPSLEVIVVATFLVA